MTKVHERRQPGSEGDAMIAGRDHLLEIDPPVVPERSSAIRFTTACSATERLSARLRASTHAAHVDVERSFRLGARLADRPAYGALLVALYGFYAPVEESLAAAPWWGTYTPPINVGSRRRAAFLAQDIVHLGRRAPDSSAHDQRARQIIDSPASALGVLYVLEGSALGGRMVARRATTALGPTLPVSFFAGNGRTALRTQWSELQAALDSFEIQHGPQAGDDVVLAAAITFVALKELLDQTFSLR